MSTDTQENVTQEVPKRGGCDQKTDEFGSESHHEVAEKTSDLESGDPETVIWTWKMIFATTGLSGLYVGSQIPVYFAGGSIAAITADIGESAASSWIVVAFALPLTAVAPFCGYLQDLCGRRYVTLFGGICLMVGVILMALTHTFRQAIAGMALAGCGAAMAELSALAG